MKLDFAKSNSAGRSPWLDALEVAHIYAHLGDADRTLDWLGQAFQEKSEYLLWLKVDPGWDKVRSDPRFVALIRKMGLEK